MGEFLAAVLDVLERFGPAMAGVAIIVALFVQAYFAKYLNVKADTLAKKEDLPDLKVIKRELEQVSQSIKHSYEELRGHARLRGQLQVAALEKRLAVHQEAYAMCRALVSAAHRTEDFPMRRFEDWWRDNCLYLTELAADAVYQAYLASSAWLRTSQTKDADANWEKIITAQDIVAREAGLVLSPKLRSTMRPESA